LVSRCGSKPGPIPTCPQRSLSSFSKLQDGGLFPYTGNMLTRFGSFGDGLVVGTRSVIFGQGTMITLTPLGCFGAGCLIDRVAQCIRERRGMNALVMFGALHVPFLFFVFIFFDRYFVPLIPTIAYFCLSTHWRPKPLNRMVTLLLVGLMAIISTVLMHDWLAWNSARWGAGSAGDPGRDDCRHYRRRIRMRSLVLDHRRSVE
jgi:hypothetical protein